MSQALPTPRLLFQTQDIRHKTLDTRHKTQDTRHQTQDTKHRKSEIGDRRSENRTSEIQMYGFRFRKREAIFTLWLSSHRKSNGIRRRQHKQGCRNAGNYAVRALQEEEQNSEQVDGINVISIASLGI